HRQPALQAARELTAGAWRGGRRPPRGTADGPGAHAPGPSRTARGSRGRVRRPPFRRLAPVSDLPPNSDADEPDPLDSFEEIIEAETSRDPDRKSTRLNSSHVKISYAVL